MAAKNQNPAEEIVRRVIGLLLQHAEPLTVSTIHQHFSRVMKKKQFEKILRGYPDHFEILDDGCSTVKLVTSLNYCKMHCSKNSNCPGHVPYCTGLHICKFYMSSKCKFKQCHFGHDLTTSHNMSVLKEHLVDGLPVPLIQKIAERPIPRICKFYNVEAGCRNNVKSRQCPNLHLCKHYVVNACKFGKMCKRSHNLTDQGILSILEKYGIETKRTPKEILADLKDLFQDDDGSDSESAESAPESLSSRTKLASVNRSRHLSEHDQSQSFHGSLLGPGPQIGVPFAGARPKTSPLKAVRLDQSGVHVLPEQFSQMKVAVPVARSARGVSPSRGAGQRSRSRSRAEKSQETMKDISQKYVCIYNLVGKCSYGARCFNYHCELPYQWMFRAKGSEDWIEVQPAENLLMELNYSDPSKEDYFIMVSGRSIKLDYSTMTTIGDHVLMFHRLSTNTSIVMDTQPLATKWIWYWKNQVGSWSKYGDEDHGYKSSLCSHEIEQAFINNPEGQLEFSTAGHNYVLNFQEMVQSNLHYKTKRAIRRRPEFVDEKEFEMRKKQGKSQPMPGIGPAGAAVDIPRPPAAWSLRVSDDLINHYRIIQLDKKNPAMRQEYQEIEDLFCKHLPSTVTIKSIERVENGELWHSYERKLRCARRIATKMSRKNDCSMEPRAKLWKLYLDKDLISV
ncbi:zinc finger CCCH-type antiviral protein 1-like isoform X2 [Dreissena polymorpha]|uniref:zinc finger CCCH-type antiviral protein 1-like isoform X2 n=1 Tax=Dreissena polymorpha TaxID=45954 RepID=UPI0022641BBB|nr:zinc finger CCCH-type antiviral protein 1-like isoform X2 [Dreissena polymorpha]